MFETLPFTCPRALSWSTNRSDSREFLVQENVEGVFGRKMDEKHTGNRMKNGNIFVFLWMENKGTSKGTAVSTFPASLVVSAAFLSRSLTLRQPCLESIHQSIWIKKVLQEPSYTYCCLWNSFLFKGVGQLQLQLGTIFVLESPICH